MRIVGRQIFRPYKTYKLSAFALSMDVPEGRLLYSFLTGKMVLTDISDELDAELVASWFYVPEECQEWEIVDKVRRLSNCMDKRKKMIREYVIMTTSDCNARCFYCFEKGMKRVSMSEETADQVVQFIKNSAHGSKVELAWFGGEPLYNESIIDRITSSLQEEHIEYSSHMTTNGYLFSEENLEKAINLWKLWKVQISLDGTEVIYNRSKAYISSDEVSPYRRVIRNINLLLDRNIQVIVRLNLGNYNFEDLLDLSDELAGYFSGRIGFTVYVNVLYQENVWQLYPKKVALNTRLIELGIGEDEYPSRFITYHCVADSPYTITVDPEGNLFACEHVNETDQIGSVFQNDNKKPNCWNEYANDIENCKNCPLYPSCHRPINCPVYKPCIEKLKRFRILMAEKEVIDWYWQHKGVINKEL